MTDLKKSIWIDAPPEVVFSYLVDAEKTSRWCGQKAELDPVPGGIYRLDMGSAGVFEGTFARIDPPHFVSWQMDPPPGMDAPPNVIEITVTAEADGARVDVVQSGLTAPFDLIASKGWDHHLARLSVTVTGGAPGPDPLCGRSLESMAG